MNTSIPPHRPHRGSRTHATIRLLPKPPHPTPLPLTLLTLLALPLTAQSPTSTVQIPPSPFHLATLFELGHLLLDENGDGVPDRLGASLILSPDPTDAERAAAAEITARLGFETMSLDLPVRRGLQPGRVGILIGLRALEVAGLSPSDFGVTIAPPPDPPDPDRDRDTEPADPDSVPEPGAESTDPDSVPTPATPPDPPPTVATLTTPDGERWVAVLGGNDEALLRAARHLAGSLPHVSNLSGPSLTDVTDDLGTWLAGSDSTAPTPSLTFHRATLPDSTNHVRLTATLAYDDDPGATRARYALDRLQILAWERVGDDFDGPGSDDLRFRSLAALTFEAAGRQVILPALVTPSPSGPGSRPRGGPKGGLDLSNLYTTGGFLGGGQIPSDVDVVVVPGRGAEGIADLTARMTLETAGFTVPIVRGLDEIKSPSSEPTSVLVGSDNPHITELIDSGTISIDDLAPGHGLIEAVPDGFGGKRALVVTGADAEGATAATKRLAEIFPNVSVRGDGKPTFDDIEHELWGTLSGYTPGGQAAFGLYKLDRVLEELTGEMAAAGERITSAEILMSLWKPSGGVADFVRERALAHFPDSIAPEVTVTIDNRDVQNATTIIDDQFEVPSEVDRFWSAFDARIVAGVDNGEPVHLEARLSEPPEIRAKVAAEARKRLIDAGADPEATTVQVLSAFKQGFSWLRESVAPRLAGREIGEIVIEFLRNEPPEEWPHQSIHTPLRWLHEIFPIDEILVADLGLDLGQIRFEMVEEGPIYRVRATAPDGSSLLEDTFDPVWVLRPYVDRFRDYEKVRVTTGWVTATAGGDTLAHERIVTDPEWVWDRFQASTLPAIWDYVMDRHDAKPSGGPDAPFFGTLTIDLELSEPDYRLGIDNEIISTMDALHEEFYFGTIEFFMLTGRNAQGGNLSYPGRIIPVMRPKGDGAAGRGNITMTGFATSRPTVIVRYETADGTSGERRRDITKVSMDRPSLYRAVIASAEEGGAGAASPALPRLDFSIEVDSEENLRDSLVALASAEFVDRSWVSAEQIVETVTNLGALRDAGLYRDALAYHDVGEMRVRVEWDEEEDEVEEDSMEAPEDSLNVEADSLEVEEDSSHVTAILPDNGSPNPLPVWTDLVPEGWSYQGERIVQWETPIPPPEGHEMTAKMSHAFDEAHMYHAGESYLGRQIWAMDLMSPIAATHWSRVKATTFKPTVIYSAREHANEVSSTSHVLRHAELLLTDSLQRARLDKVNVVIHPFTNPDGAQLAYDLYRITPDYILHAGYLGSLGVGVGSGFGSFPIYPESKVRGELWDMWFPDIFLNPHGYPSHQVVQLFSEYSGLVRGGRVTERNWGFNKGWFMPGFSYIDDPSFPRHKDAAFKIRDYITAGINSNSDVFEMNQRTYDRYRRYGADFDTEVFQLPMTDSVMIHMPLRGSPGFGGGGSFSPRITIWSGITEAPDETAHGPWMELVAKAGLSWDQAILDYLFDGDHEVDRSGSAFLGGATLRMNRARPPREKKEDEGGQPG